MNKKEFKKLLERLPDYSRAFELGDIAWQKEHYGRCACHRGVDKFSLL